MSRKYHWDEWLQKEGESITLAIQDGENLRGQAYTWARKRGAKVSVRKLAPHIYKCILVQAPNTPSPVSGMRGAPLKYPSLARLQVGEACSIAYGYPKQKSKNRIEQAIRREGWHAKKFTMEWKEIDVRIRRVQ